MKGKTAALLLLATCAILAGMLLASAITPWVSGSAFAIALVSLGCVSRGFGKASSG
jgi:hypothetical protein